MESIIEFIFGNLFFVILILGALFNFLRKSKAEEKTPRRQSERKEEEIDWKEIFKHEQEPQSKHTERVPEFEPIEVNIQVPAAEDNIGKKTELPRASLQKMKRQAEEQAMAIKNKQHAQTGLRLDFKHLTNDDAKRGLIWAEVLGKPRAKRPHSR